MRNPCLDAVTRELILANIHYKVEDLGKHLSVLWWHDKRPRRVTVARTPSDWRAPLNDRSIVRRLLREDGIDIDALPKAPPRVATLEQALAAPKDPDEIISEKLARVEAELKLVADLVLSVAPAFEATLDEVRAGEGAAKFAVALDLAPQALGRALGALYGAGFLPHEVSVTAVGVPQRLAIPPLKANGARRHWGDSVTAFLRLNRPSTAAQMRDGLGMGPKHSAALAQQLNTLRHKGMIKPSDQRGGPWSLAEV